MVCKTAKLQAIANQHFSNNPDFYRFTVEYCKEARRWWAIPEEPRWFGDKGEPLGKDYAEAIKGLDFIFNGL